MVIGALVFCSGAAWYFWPSSHQHADAAAAIPVPASSTSSEPIAPIPVTAYDIQRKQMYIDDIRAKIADIHQTDFAQLVTMNAMLEIDIRKSGTKSIAKKWAETMSQLNQKTQMFIREVETSDYQDVVKALRQRSTWGTPPSGSMPVALPEPMNSTKAFADLLNSLPDKPGEDALMLLSGNPKVLRLRQVIDAYTSWILGFEADLSQIRAAISAR
jgi:hypothetical protein